jgi:diguanylate cyclase (GGDEF)-like protein
MAAAAAGFVSGRLTLPIDLNAHTASASGWILFLVVLTIVPMVVLYAVGGLQRHLLLLVDTLQAQRAQLEAQHLALERLASHDQLTGLPLMGLAGDRLRKALHAAERHGGRVGFLFVDLDGFKAINDGYGHDLGDEVLRAVAARLQAAVRAEDTVARIGGDEFAVVAVHLLQAEDALQVAAQIVDALVRPVRVGGRDFEVGASVGVALYPDHAGDADTLRRRADAAMYRAKQAGGRRVALADVVPATAPVGTPGEGAM